MALAATFAGLGFGNAGVHMPHANAYPIAGQVRDFRPDGLRRRPGDGAARHGGLAHRSGGVPLDVRGVARTARSRCRAARPRPRPTTSPDHLPDVLDRPDARRRHPAGLAAVGYAAGDVDDLVEGTMKQQRLLATAPREVTEDDVAGILHLLDRALVRLPRTTSSRRCAGAGVPDVDDSDLARALYTTDASLYRIAPLAVVRPRHVDEVAARSPSRARPACR